MGENSHRLGSGKYLPCHTSGARHVQALEPSAWEPPKEGEEGDEQAKLQPLPSLIWGAPLLARAQPGAPHSKGLRKGRVCLLVGESGLCFVLPPRLPGTRSQGCLLAPKPCRGIHRLQPQVLMGETEYGNQAPSSASLCPPDTRPPGLGAGFSALGLPGIGTWAPGARLGWPGGDWPGATQQHAACSPPPLWSGLQPKAPAHTLTQLRFYFRPSLMLSTVQQI